MLNPDFSILSEDRGQALTIDRRNSKIVRAIVRQTHDAHVVRLNDVLVALPQEVLALETPQTGRMVVDERAFVHVVHTILHRKTGYLVYERVGRDRRVAREAVRRLSRSESVVIGLAEDHSVLEEAGASGVG